MIDVTIYTDGACSKNPGKGGWAAVLIHKDKEKQISGYEENTTNNRMELTAIIMALKELKKSCNITLYTDSKYCCDSINQGWLENWIKNNWVKSDKKKVLNQDLWEELVLLMKNHKISFNHVKGHDGNKYNEICDKLAVEEYKKRE